MFNRFERSLSAIAIAGLAFSSCVNGTVGGAPKSLATSNQENSTKISDPVIVGSSGGLVIEAKVVAPFVTATSGGNSKGVLISIQKQLETLARNHGGLASFLQQATNDPTFGNQVLSIYVRELSIKIELPLARLDIGSGAAYNGIIIRADGRLAFVYSHVLPEANAAIIQTHTDRITVYGGTHNSDASDRVIQLPLNGGIGVPGRSPETDGMWLNSFYSENIIAIASDASDITSSTVPAAGVSAVQNSVRALVYDFLHLRRNGPYAETTTEEGARACSGSSNFSDQDRVFANAGRSTAIVISRKKNSDGTWGADEVMLCGDSNAKISCQTYFRAWAAEGVTRYCGQSRSKYGVDKTKTDLLTAILKYVEPPTLPSTITIKNDPDGSGQVTVSPI